MKNERERERRGKRKLNEKRKGCKGCNVCANREEWVGERKGRTRKGIS